MLKLRSVGFSLVLILLSMLGVSYANVTEDNISSFIAPDASSVADYLVMNFSTFVDKFNEDAEVEWTASYVENRYKIHITDWDDEYVGEFLDFNGANGYAVVGNDYQMLDFSADDDSPYKNVEADEYYFSTTGGYFYQKDGEVYSTISALNVTEEELLNTETSAASYYAENGSGCGRIVLPNTYVNEKYNGGWSLLHYGTINMSGYTQEQLSVYKKSQSYYNYQTEGNCWFVSAYHVLQYLQQAKYYDMPSRTNVVAYEPSIEERNIYNQYYKVSSYSDPIYKHKNKTDIVYSSGYGLIVYEYERINYDYSFPLLYTKVRKYVNDHYDTVQSGTPSQTQAIITDVAKQYGHTVTTDTIALWSFHLDDARKKIDNFMPLIWITQSGTYGNHTMTVCGYRYYKKTTKILFVNINSYKTLFEVKDGEATESRYFDMSDFVGFGMLIDINAK